MPKAQPKEKLIRYAYIDSLRCFAIILVLLAHTSIVGSINYPGWLYDLTYIYIGPRGVQLFFVVSAFTLYMSWSRRKSNEKHILRNFYIRRFFRIAPLFYFAIIYFLYIQNYWNGNPNHITTSNILSTFFFINGAVPPWINNIVYGGWSITVEMTFYIFFPFIISKLYSIRVAVIVTFITMILAQFLRLNMNNLPIFHSSYPTYTFEFFPSQLPVFLIGITLFLLMKNVWSQKDKKMLKIFTVFSIILLIIQFTFKLHFIPGYYLYGIFFGFLIYFLSVKPIRLLVNPVTVHIGKVSYSIYLSHIIVLYFLAKNNLINYYPQYPILNFILRFSLLLLISTCVATVLYYLIERPGEKLGKKIIDHFEKKPTSEIAVVPETY
jgi:peptidoglycan/LPS O-acetylase OafA/YrhL